MVIENYSIPKSEVTEQGIKLVNYIINTIGESNFNSMWEDENLTKEIVLQAKSELYKS